MTPPPIRYPLPTLVLMLVLGLLAWRGDARTAAWRAAWSRGWNRPSSRARPSPPRPTPQVVAGPIVRRVLLLHDDVPAASRPGGPAPRPIRHRPFADSTTPGRLRAGRLPVGNRRPIGWVAAADLLPWDTRLVVRADGGDLALADSAGGPPGPAVPGRRPVLPVLDIDGDSIQIALSRKPRPTLGRDRQNRLGDEDATPPGRPWRPAQPGRARRPCHPSRGPRRASLPTPRDSGRSWAAFSTRRRSRPMTSPPHVRPSRPGCSNGPPRTPARPG